jgi:DNA-binding Xre family transcriptional regulator
VLSQQERRKRAQIMKTKEQPIEDKLVFFDHSEAMERLHKKKPGHKKAYEDLKPVFEIISAFIKLRNENKISQKKLEELTSVAQTNISRFESGKIKNFSFGYLNKLVEPLGYRTHVTFEKVR